MKYLTEEERRAAKSESSRKWNAKNKEKMTAYYEEYNRTHKKENAARCRLYEEKNKERIQKYRNDNKEHRKAYNKEYREKNLDKIIAYNVMRKAKKLNRTPSWLTEDDHKKIKEIYTQSRLIEEQTGIKHHVDHIIPLQGNNVSGLHIPENLQIITAEENLIKSNMF